MKDRATMTHHERIAPLAELQANVSVPFAQARAMPRSVYLSQDFLDIENRDIFGKEWLCAGRASALAKPGDYLTMEIAGKPVIVVRDRDMTLRAFSNVCMHRMSTLLQGSGNTRAIVCPYHAWTYSLDGSLRGTMAMEQNEGFCKDHYKLPTFRCEEWLGWIMVSINPDIEPAAQKFAHLGKLVERYGMENYVQAFSETMEWDTNWKILAENFMESYHVPICHRKTIGPQVSLDEVELEEGHPTYNYHCSLKGEENYLALAHPDNTRLEGEDRRRTYIISLYPGLFISLSPGYFWYLSLYPIAPGKVQVVYGGGLAPEFIADGKSAEHFAALKSLLDEVNEEDKGCTEKVFNGLRGGLAEPGHLSHLERPNYDFAKYIASKLTA
ncbi:Rieske 2Fe-2S domain-containing protein [Acetobacter sp. TBRC 12305]|uniref:Rieske 2Fe-2S domain-containing protein n=1 Tax=Acetobacter garciniae TaxID=2817435 RepID=A0A939KRN3_9PROT|nr:SRPBCC family protein [Acetobacter garciniae]MBO1325556.1 Rieske 2Fe-2S domain-containing protein [Acetobacter garciniae]MBX0345272.1 Rieske 2Fe-2S domain-containing protein [Acetobacter garciniae]